MFCNQCISSQCFISLLPTHAPKKVSEVQLVWNVGLKWVIFVAMINVLTLMFKCTEEKVSSRYLVGPYDVVPKWHYFFVIWRYLFACEGLIVKIWKMTPIRAGVNLGQANKGQRDIHLLTDFDLPCFSRISVRTFS